MTSFITDFYFQQLAANGDGMTFAIQGQGPAALGGSGGSLGYQGIPNSVAVKFDLFSNAGEGPNSTGLYTDGASPTLPATDMTSSGVNLHSGDAMWAHILYDGANLTLTLTDTVTKAAFTKAFPINIPATVGGNTAYVGFTGGTGGSTAIQNVLAWDWVSPATQSVAIPTFFSRRRLLYQRAVDYHQRCHQQRHCLLHHRWKHADHLFDRLQRTDLGECNRDAERHRSRDWTHHQSHGHRGL